MYVSLCVLNDWSKAERDSPSGRTRHPVQGKWQGLHGDAEGTHDANVPPLDKTNLSWTQPSTFTPTTSGRRDSNPRHPAPKAGALPTAPHPVSASPGDRTLDPPIKSRLLYQLS